jgi:hydrogenase/urease accessory protein HupE
MRLRFLAWLAFIVVGLPVLVQAHEVRPGYLQITEAPDHAVRVLWRMPIQGDYGLPIRPSLSSGWLDRVPERTTQDGVELTEQWTVAAPHAPLKGQTIRIDGLEKTITDVLLRVEFSDGKRFERLIRGSDPSVTIPSLTSSSVGLASYFLLGIRHIWTGIDHLLYVLGLMLLVRSVRTLFWTLTAFTLAHSITLAAATLGIVDIPPAPVEACIALSIVYVAVELVRSKDRAVPRPWLIAFAFGLLHGFGFAGALREVGLPAHEIPQALFLFNLGIEAGQVSFVALALLTLGTLRAVLPALEFNVRRAVPYVVGSLASFWLIERSLVAFQLIAP